MRSLARRRPSYGDEVPGSRAFASAGLPGADWWVACLDGAERLEVEVDEVLALYTENDLWESVYGTRRSPDVITGTQPR